MMTFVFFFLICSQGKKRGGAGVTYKNNQRERDREKDRQRQRESGRGGRRFTVTVRILK